MTVTDGASETRRLGPGVPKREKSGMDRTSAISGCVTRPIVSSSAGMAGAAATPRVDGSGIVHYLETFSQVGARRRARAQFYIVQLRTSGGWRTRTETSRVGFRVPTILRSREHCWE